MKRREPLLTPESAAELLNVSVRALRARCRRQTIPFYRVGRSLRFSEREIRRFLREHRVATREESLIDEMFGGK